MTQGRSGCSRRWSLIGPIVPGSAAGGPGSVPGIVRTIDTKHLGRGRVIAAHAADELIVDPGPASALDNWIGDLGFEPRALLLTHIHLDHAGATGVLARRFPDLKVYVSEVGAPHL